MAVTNVNTFGRGTGPIYVDNIGCTGTEPRLLACHYDMDTTDCFHAHDAGVRCNPECKFHAEGCGLNTIKSGGVQIPHAKSDLHWSVFVEVDMRL